MGEFQAGPVRNFGECLHVLPRPSLLCTRALFGLENELVVRVKVGQSQVFNANCAYHASARRAAVGRHQRQRFMERSVEVAVDVHRGYRLSPAVHTHTSP